MSDAPKPESGLLGTAQAAPAEFSFLQISDSHVGFDRPANPNVLATLEEAIGKVQALPVRPAFMIHTGDITHLSKAKEFDDAAQMIGRLKLDGHYVPGEHDVVDEGNGKEYMERYGKGARGAGRSWQSGAARRQNTCATAIVTSAIAASPSACRRA